MHSSENENFTVRFIMVVWGDSYVDTLCDICVASLLAAGNTPYFASHFTYKFHFYH